MAITKIWPCKCNMEITLDYVENKDKVTGAAAEEKLRTYQAFEDVIEYATNADKTTPNESEAEERLFVDGVNCDPFDARDDFYAVKRAAGKTDGIQVYHAVLSFKEGQDKITPEYAHKAGLEFAKRVWGDRFQVVVATHLNTDHLHCHFVINSVSFADYKRLADNEKNWYKLRHVADDICKEFELHTLSEKTRFKAYGKFDKLLIQADVDFALSRSKSKKQFEYVLKKLGYYCNLDDNHKYWTVTPIGGYSMRLFRLGENYSNENIQRTLDWNKENGCESYNDKQYNLTTRKERILLKSGIYRQYLYYCYKFGLLPNYYSQRAKVDKSNYEAWKELDKLSKEMFFMEKYDICTIKQLSQHSSKTEQDIETLTAERTQLKNRLRRNGITDSERDEIKAKTADITSKLRALRKELGMCRSIALKSPAMEKSINEFCEVAEQDEQEKQEKQMQKAKRDKALVQ